MRTKKTSRFARHKAQKPLNGRFSGNHAPAPKPKAAARRAPEKTPQGVKPKPYYKPKPPKTTATETLRTNPQGVLLWGLHAGRAAWLNPNRHCYRLWVTEAGRDALAGAFGAATLENLKRPSPVVVERQALDRLLPQGSVHQGVVLEAESLPDRPLHTLLKISEQPDLLIVLDHVTDPHNVGAILRSAAAFGASAVIMTERNAPSTTGVLAKAASGAVEHVPLVYVTNLVRALSELQEAGYWCIGLSEEAQKNLSEHDLSARIALVLGNEGEGLRRLTRETCDELARLPTGGAIGSLNVSNAAAVALYEARKQKTRF